MIDKPDKITSADDLKDYYWLKSELINFCKAHYLPTQGAKLALIERIVSFLLGEAKTNYKPMTKIGEKDSSQCINKNTLVKNYYNDTKTREFFIEHIGRNFKFNTYLRQFTDPNNIQPHMTYGDLVEGWLSYEMSRKNSTQEPIPQQFEYNQFIKDYFKYEKGATLKRAIREWKILTSKKGPRTYKQFKKNVVESG